MNHRNRMRLRTYIMCRYGLRMPCYIMEKCNTFFKERDNSKVIASKRSGKND